MLSSKSRIINLYSVSLVVFVLIFLPVLSIFAEVLAQNSEDFSSTRKDVIGFVLNTYKSPQELFDEATILYDQRNYKQAAAIFNKVYNQAKDPVLKRKALLSGELINSILKIDRVNLQAAEKELKNLEKLSKIQKKEEIVRFYKEAYAHLDKENYLKAQEVFQAIENLDPSQEDAREYAHIKIPAIIKEQKLELLYPEARAYFKNKDYQKADIVFNAILALDPGQQEAKNYVKIRIPALLKKQKIDALYTEAVTVFEKGDYQKARDKFNDLIVLDPEHEEVNEYVLTKIPQALKSSRTQSLYVDAMTAYSAEDYSKATALFSDVLHLNPKDKEAKKYIEKNIPGILRDQKIKALLAETTNAYNSSDAERATCASNEVLSLSPENKEAQAYVEEKIPALVKNKRIDDLYGQAREVYSTGDHYKANSIFQQILSLDPEQREAREYVETKIPKVFKEMKVKTLYVDAINAYQAVDYSRANMLFNQILELNAEEKEAKKYVSEKIPAALKEQKIRAFYTDAIMEFNNKHYDKAMIVFSTILALDPLEQGAREYVEVTIPAALRADKVSVMFARGQEAYNSADYESALTQFNDILVLDPENKLAREYAEVKIPTILREQKIASLYLEVDEDCNLGDYPKATNLCKEILFLDPSQQKAKEYIDSKIPVMIKDKQMKAFIAEAVDYFDNSEYDKSAIVFNTILSFDPLNKEAKEYLEEKIPAKQKEQKSNQLYTNALQVFISGDYQKSLGIFNELLVIDPVHKKARDYVDNKIPEILKQQKVNCLYREGLQYLNAGDYQKAVNVFKDVLAVDPQNNEAKEYAEVKIPDLLKQEEIQSLYNQAFEAYRSCDYERSSGFFKEILALDPSDEKANLYLNTNIPFRLKEKEIQAVNVESPVPQTEVKPVVAAAEYPKDGIVGYLYELALKNYEDKDYKEAKRYFEQILLIRPTESAAKSYLNNILR